VATEGTSPKGKHGTSAATRKISSMALRPFALCVSNDRSSLIKHRRARARSQGPRGALWTGVLAQYCVHSRVHFHETRRALREEERVAAAEGHGHGCVEGREGRGVFLGDFFKTKHWKSHERWMLSSKPDLMSTVHRKPAGSKPHFLETATMGDKPAFGSAAVRSSFSGLTVGAWRTQLMMHGEHRAGSGGRLARGMYGVASFCASPPDACCDRRCRLSLLRPGACSRR
jgi:hypothetical protein